MRPEAVVTAAVAALARVRGEYQAAKFPLEQRFDMLTRELDKAEPEALAAFRQDMEAEIARTQAEGYSTQAPYSGVVRSNWLSVNARIAAILASRVGVNDLRYEALTEAELADRLAAIRAGWPAIVDVETAA